MPKQVLSVGQCGYDEGTLSRYLGGRFDVEVLSADGSADALELLATSNVDLVLINRRFDRDGGDGVELIRTIHRDGRFPSTKLMLVSNDADAQRRAIEAGALPGFGKAEYHRPETEQKLADALKGASRAVDEPPSNA